jgi:hypothetical protein
VKPKLTPNQRQCFDDYTSTRKLINRQGHTRYEVRMSIGVQSFGFNNPTRYTTRAEAEWMRAMVAKALSALIDEHVPQ